MFASRVLFQTVILPFFLDQKEAHFYHRATCKKRNWQDKTTLPHLRQPVVLRSSREDWNLTLWSSRCETLLQPEWGMTTVLVSVLRASRMMVIFTASHEERFHRTPMGAGCQWRKFNICQEVTFLTALEGFCLVKGIAWQFYLNVIFGLYNIAS